MAVERPNGFVQESGVRTSLWAFDGEREMRLKAQRHRDGQTPREDVLGLMGKHNTGVMVSGLRLNAVGRALEEMDPRSPFATPDTIQRLKLPILVHNHVLSEGDRQHVQNGGTVLVDLKGQITSI